MSDSKDSSKKSWLKWFKSTSSTTSNIATEFNEELWITIQSSSPVEMRIAKLNQLSYFIANNQIERKIVEKLWIETKDLLNPQLAKSITMSYFNFLNILIKSQYRQLGMLKRMLFQDLKNLPYIYYDYIVNVMLAINYLTDQGKNLDMMENEVIFKSLI